MARPIQLESIDGSVRQYTNRLATDMALDSSLLRDD
jgi:hypothetical protein